MPSSRALANVTVNAFRRGALTAVLLAVVLVFFWVMVRDVLLAAFLGLVAAVFLRPVYTRILGWAGRPALAAVLTLLVVIVPALVAIVYGYMEVRAAATYLAQNASSVAADIQGAIASLPFVGDAQVQGRVEGLLDRAAELGTEVPAGLQSAIGGLSVAAAVFLFTAFYVLTDAESIIAYLRERVPPRYAGLTERLELNARGVLYGALFATLVTQAIKGLWILALMLAFGVPLPFTLALIAFVIGFFPVVGSWTVYLPAAGYVLVFQDAPLKALLMVVVAFVVSTPLLSFYVRPKLAADRSEVLNFYWMFIALIAGVYTFGIPGIVAGPLLVGLLKGLVDVLTADDPWSPPETEGETHEPTVLTEDELDVAEQMKESETSVEVTPARDAASDDPSA